MLRDCFYLFKPLVAQCHTTDITIQILWFLITQQIQGGNGFHLEYKSSQFIREIRKNYSKTHIASSPPKKAQRCLFTKWISCLTENPLRNNASAAASAASAADGSCGQKWTKKRAPIRPLSHYFLQLGRNGLGKRTFATLTKPHEMIPIVRSNVSDVLIEEPLHERHVVDFLRYTEWGSLFSNKLSTYLRIFYHLSSNISSTYSKYHPHMFHMFYIYTYFLSVSFPHMYQICSLNLDDYVFFQFVCVTTCLSHICPKIHILH